VFLSTLLVDKKLKLENGQGVVGSKLLRHFIFFNGVTDNAIASNISVSTLFSVGVKN